MKKPLLLSALCSLLFAATLAAVYIILDPETGLTYTDTPPPELSGSTLSAPGSLLILQGSYPRYVVQYQRTADGARSPLHVFDSSLRAQAAAAAPPAGWHTIPVEPWQLDRLQLRTGQTHIGL